MKRKVELRAKIALNHAGRIGAVWKHDFTAFQKDSLCPKFYLHQSTDIVLATKGTSGTHNACF